MGGAFLGSGFKEREFVDDELEDKIDTHVSKEIKGILKERERGDRNGYVPRRSTKN